MVNRKEYLYDAGGDPVTWKEGELEHSYCYKKDKQKPRLATATSPLVGDILPNFNLNTRFLTGLPRSPFSMRPR